MNSSCINILRDGISYEGSVPVYNVDLFLSTFQRKHSASSENTEGAGTSFVEEVKEKKKKKKKKKEEEDRDEEESQVTVEVSFSL